MIVILFISALKNKHFKDKAFISTSYDSQSAFDKPIKLNIFAKKGSTLSFIPYGGDCKFNCSNGLYYPLNKLTLTTADTRGISNVVMDCAVEYDIDYGQALVVYEK